MGLVELQSLSARTVDAGAGAGAEGDDGEDGGCDDGVGDEVAFVRGFVGWGGGGGVAHL